jgi:hypothetical protein
VLAALSTLTRARRVALALGVSLVVCTGINNGLQFDQALQLFERLKTSHQTVQGTILQRSDDLGTQ